MCFTDEEIRNKASQSSSKLCFFRSLEREKEKERKRAERAREREMERKRRKRGLKNTTSLLKFFESPRERKKKDQKHKSERRVLSPVTETTTKKTIHIGF